MFKFADKAVFKSVTTWAGLVLGGVVATVANGGNVPTPDQIAAGTAVVTGGAEGVLTPLQSLVAGIGTFLGIFGFRRAQGEAIAAATRVADLFGDASVEFVDDPDGEDE